MSSNKGFWATGEPRPEVIRDLRAKLQGVLSNAISNGNGSIELNAYTLARPDDMRVYALASLLDELGWELSFKIEPRKG